MKEWPSIALVVMYHIGTVITFMYLSFFKDYGYTWWNWIFVVPINLFLAEIWPIYWVILHWI
jgi:hypothetical protein